MWNEFKNLAFLADAERIHDTFVSAVRLTGSISPRLLNRLSGDLSTSGNYSFFGKSLRAPVGLAAGFDKNALILPYLHSLRFSFAEIGSITLRPQAGNPKPRLFRQEESLFNRMGFNNDGAEKIAERLSKYKPRDDFAVGVNIGLNKETLHPDAANEYLEVFKILFNYGDYFVVNVSSPNTPGLRELQEIREIEKIFTTLKSFSAEKKVFVKLAPEISLEALSNIIERSDVLGIDGFVLTNTLQGTFQGQNGGWSGAPLLEHSVKILKVAREKTTKPIISVGGIMSVEDALNRKSLGANLIEIYTGWIFRGPRFPAAVSRAWIENEK